MGHETSSETEIGRVRAALVFGAGEAATAVLAPVTAQVLESAENDEAPPLRIAGPVGFEAAAEQQLRTTVAPLVNRILDRLGLAPVGFELSLANPGAASVHELPTTIGGYSADAAAFLAMLSAALHLPIPVDCVVTGHLASPAGELAPVRSIGPKARAAAADPATARFCYPDLDREGSLEALSPRELESAQAGLLEAGRHVQTIAVADVAGLLEAIVEEHTIPLAALEGSWWCTDPEPPIPGDPAERAAAHLQREHATRFWAALDAALHAGAPERAKHLLHAYAAWHRGAEAYPTAFGRRLTDTLRRLPDAHRRLELAWPLLDPGDCLRLARLGAEADAEDVRWLFQAATGKGLARPHAEDEEPKPADRAEGAAWLVLAQVRSDRLARDIGRPVHEAREAFAAPAITTDRRETFFDTLAAFHRQLRHHVEGGPGPEDPERDEEAAIELVEEAFARDGGFEAAWAEARFGTQGGLRRVLDAMAGAYEQRLRHRRVTRVLKEAVDPLDWDGRVRLMRQLLEPLRPALPPELAQMPPERCARRWEQLVPALAGSLDRFADRLRCL